MSEPNCEKCPIEHHDTEHLEKLCVVTSGMAAKTLSPANSVTSLSSPHSDLQQCWEETFRPRASFGFLRPSPVDYGSGRLFSRADSEMSSSRFVAYLRGTLRDSDGKVFLPSTPVTGT